MTQQKNGRRYIHDCAQLMAEWNQEKNSALGLDPKEITCGSSKAKVWWICEKGHEWLAKPNNRTSGKGCPYCSGRKVSRGENDLETKYPELIEEWDYETNAPVLPSEIMPKTNKTYWWECKICGNKWSATPNSRTSGAGCPRCAKRFHSSFPEQAIFYYVILTGRSNRLEQIYSSFATSLRKCTDKGGISSTIKDKLIKPLDILFPLCQVFCDKFVRLSYSKIDSPLNVKAKYAISRINCVYSGVELFPDDGSIEHIFPESSGGESTNIGNLIMLEGQLNEDAGQKKYEEKRLDYEKSKYPWIQKFIADHQNWHAEDIGKRAEQLAFFYYTEVFKMTVPQREVSTSDTNIQDFASEIIS